MKIVGIILSVIAYIFGVLFIWGAFGDPFDSSSLIIGIIMIGIGSAIMLIITRKGKAEKASKNVTGAGQSSRRLGYLTTGAIARHGKRVRRNTWFSSIRSRSWPHAGRLS